MIEIKELCEPLRYMIYDMYSYSKAEAEIYIIPNKRELLWIKDNVKDLKLNGFIQFKDNEVIVNRAVFYKVRV